MGGDWSRISANDTELERFRQGIDFIIAGTRTFAAPDPCDWRTPIDPLSWTWGRGEYPPIYRNRSMQQNARFSQVLSRQRKASEKLEANLSSKS